MTFVDQSTRSASAYLRDVLNRYGLGSLTQWALDRLYQGSSETEILQSMRETPEFKTRFPAIFEREAAGLPAISPAEYVEYENRAQQAMRAAGLPPGYYDEPADFARLLAANVSVNELQSRIDDGFTRVAQAPQEVRDAFAYFYGADGDAAFAAFYLDPQRALPVLMRQAAAAQFAGTGARYGINVERDLAERVAAVSPPNVEAGLAQLSQQRRLYDETITESDDLSIAQEGIAATFGLDAGSQEKVRRRNEQRASQFQGSGSPSQSNEGVRGLGNARGA